MAEQRRKGVSGSVVLALVLSGLNAGLSVMVSLAGGSQFLSAFLAILAFCPWITLLSVRAGQRGLLSRRMRAVMLVFGIAMLLVTLVMGYNYIELAFSAPLLVVILMAEVGLGYLAYSGWRAAGSWKAARVKLGVMAALLAGALGLAVTGNHGMLLALPVWFVSGLTGLALMAYTLGQWLAEYGMARQERAQQGAGSVVQRTLLPPGYRRRRPQVEGASGGSRRRRLRRNTEEE